MCLSGEGEEGCIDGPDSIECRRGRELVESYMSEHVDRKKYGTKIVIEVQMMGIPRGLRYKLWWRARGLLWWFSRMTKAGDDGPCGGV
jgi:hypothetical protein